MADDLTVRVARLEAAEAIRALKACYADICDTGYDPDRMVELFTEDALWDGGDRFGAHRGRDAIYTFFDGVRREIVWALHYMVGPVIEVADDAETARGAWYLWQPCTMRKGDDVEAVWIAGRYADRYRRDGDVWKFTEVRLSVEMITPFDEGWVRRRFRHS